MSISDNRKVVIGGGIKELEDNGSRNEERRLSISFSDSNSDSRHTTDDSRRTEYNELMKQNPKRSSFVPNPIKLSSDNSNLTNNFTDPVKYRFGIYKYCFGKTKIIKKCPSKSQGIQSLNFSNDGKHIVLGYRSGSVQGIKASTGKLHSIFVKGSNTLAPITCIRFNTNPFYSDIFFTSNSTGKIMIMSTQEDKPKIPIIKEYDNEIHAIDLNKTGKNLVSAGKDATIRLYDIRTCQLTRSFARENNNDDPEEKTAGFHIMRIFVVRFHPDNENIFVSGGWDSLVKIWDIRTRTGCVDTIIGPHISGETVDVKRNTLLTGSFMPDEGLELWDLRTTKRIKALNPVNVVRNFTGKFISVAQFFHGDPMGDIIISANIGFKALDIISIKLNMTIYSFNCSERVAAVQSRNSRIAFGDTGKNFHIGTFNIAGKMNGSSDDISVNR